MFLEIKHSDQAGRCRVTRRSTRRFGRSLHARSGISAFASILQSAEKASFGRSEQLLLVLQTPSRRNYRQVQLDYSIARVIAAPSSRTHRESIRDIFSPASRSRQRLVVASEKNKIRNVNGSPLSLPLLSSKTRSSKIPRDANVRFLKRRRGASPDPARTDPRECRIHPARYFSSGSQVRRGPSLRHLLCNFVLLARGYSPFSFLQPGIFLSRPNHTYMYSFQLYLATS